MKTAFFVVSILILIMGITPAYADWFADIGSSEIHGTLVDKTVCAAWGDYNNDGYEDLYVGNLYDIGSNGKLLKNNGDDSFEDVTTQADIGNPFRDPFGCAWGDYDNDGYLDLIISNSGGLYDSRNVLYHNLGPDGQGIYHFEVNSDPETQDQGIGKGAIWGDFNNDGLLDLYIINTFASSSKMLKNEGGGNFSIQDQPTCLPTGNYNGHDVVAGDVDNDGDLDIYLVTRAISYSPNLFFRNQGNFDFTEEAYDSEIWLIEAIFCVGATFFDYDFDGDLDLSVIAEESSYGVNYLFQNDGIDPVTGFMIFEDVSVDAGMQLLPPVPFGGGWSDFDLDGDADFAIPKYYGEFVGDNTMWENRLIQQVPPPWFVDVTPDAGIDDGGLGHCLAWADYDNDGKTDLFLGNFTYPDFPFNNDELNKLFQNQYPIGGNKYLNIKLIGTSSNISAIGSQVTVSYSEGGIQVDQLVEVSGGGHGNHSQPSLVAEFGCGSAQYVDVLVNWPSGETSIFEDVATNQRITIVEPGTYSVADVDIVWDHNIFGHYYISGDVTFANNSLEIAPGTNVYFHDAWETEEPASITFTDGIDVTIAGEEGDEVLFTSQQTNPPFNWKGIIAADGANLNFNYATIEYPIDAVYSEKSSLTFENCFITSCGNSGVTAIYPYSFRILESQFTNNDLYAITVMNESAERVVMNVIDISGVTRYGIRYFGITPPTEVPFIDDVDIVYYQGPNEVPPPYYGIELGIDELGNRPEGQVSNIRIEGYEDAIHLSEVEGTMIGPGVECRNSINGILLDKALVEIDGSDGANVFEENENRAFLSYYSAGKVRYSNFAKSPFCVDIEENGDVIDFGLEEPEDEWGNNSIIADPEITEMLFYVNDCEFEYPAQMNWWGSDEPEYIESMVSECVIWEPFHEEPPPPPKLTSEEIELPTNLTLAQAYPNPFNAQVTIKFTVPKSTMASVKVYNILGQEICELYNQYMEAGETSIIWDGRDNSGSVVASGVYLYAVQTDDEVKVNKMLLLK